MFQPPAYERISLPLTDRIGFGIYSGITDSLTESSLTVLNRKRKIRKKQ
jgi:hypothetical protein